MRLACHDWAAAVGWQFCMKHPEGVDRYVAVSVGHPAVYAKGPIKQKIKLTAMLLVIEII